jgi:hypothetical protein
MVSAMSQQVPMIGIFSRPTDRVYSICLLVQDLLALLGLLVLLLVSFGVPMGEVIRQLILSFLDMSQEKVVMEYVMPNM